MFYNGIIFDLDNTIYSYDKCHSSSLNNVITFILEDTNFTKEDIKILYENISKNIKYELKNTASSHNKSIYFKQLLESLNLSYSLLSKMNDIYWNTFYKNMECFEGVREFIMWNKKIGKKIGVLTDYETEFQIIKLEKLELLEYIDVIITSEEVGIEKPSIHMFQTILRKMNLLASEVIMIGDSYEKDIQGAINIDILSYFYNITSCDHYCNKEKYIEFSNFVSLHKQFNKIYNELIQLKTISKYCGERFDLVQAGGGNSSVKMDDLMFIKASGFHLTQISSKGGYVTINNKNLKEDIVKNKPKSIINYNVIGNLRASIETYMHSILKKYTIHLHPIQINKILISKDCKDIIRKLVPNSLIIDYFTPGINVCNEILKLYNNEEIIFLINHGIIITSNDYNTILIKLEELLIIFEKKQNLDFNKYKLTNNISEIINKDINNNIEIISYFCEDNIINKFLLDKKELFEEAITFPDALIYCGIKILFIDSLEEIKKYLCKYNEPPKVIVCNELIYIINISIQKCKETEDVLKSNLMILHTDNEKIYLTNDEICYLNNWDLEKYRKML
jgi:FMN phosphatase YigB (HAD superfamily)